MSRAAELILEEALSACVVKALRENRVQRGALSDVINVNALTVLTGGGFVYNLQLGEVLYVTQVFYELTTPSDTLRVEFGYTDAANGLGTFYSITPVVRMATPAALDISRMPSWELLLPPLKVVYQENVCMSFTAQVQTNDAAARMSIGWHGWKDLHMAEAGWVRG